MTDDKKTRNPSFVIYDTDKSVRRPEIGDRFEVVKITEGVLDLHWGYCTDYELQLITRD